MAPAPSTPSMNGGDPAGASGLGPSSSAPPRADELLSGLLPRAVPRPRLVHTEDGGAVLVAALHCLMVEAGFRHTQSRGSEGEAAESLWSRLGVSSLLQGFGSEYRLGTDWNGHYENAWMFEYTRQDAPGTFALHCSLAKGMLIVCGSEAGNPDNYHMLSLRVSKYVPELVRCRQATWEGVLENTETLVSSFRENVSVKLSSGALRPRNGAAASASPLAEGKHIKYLAGASAVALAVGLLMAGTYSMIARRR